MRPPAPEQPTIGPARLERLGAGDIPALAELMAASALMQRYGVTGSGAASALRDALGQGDQILVARAGRDEQPLGLAWVILTRAFNRAAYLRLLLVSAGREGAGLGTALLQATEALARDQANHLLLLTTEDNRKAHRFYERHGYARAGTLFNLVLPEMGEVLYHKALRPPEARLRG